MTPLATQKDQKQEELVSDADQVYVEGVGVRVSVCWGVSIAREDYSHPHSPFVRSTAFLCVNDRIRKKFLVRHIKKQR